MRSATTVTALIIEDEPLARRRLRELARGLSWLSVIGEAATVSTAVAAIDAEQPDLVFLDVRLSGGSGLDVLARARHQPAVIFTTAYDQFAVAAFEAGAVDYLLKPFGRERFTKALTRAWPALSDRAPVEGAAVSERPRADLPIVERTREVTMKGPLRRLFVRDGSRIVPLATISVERIDACDDFVVVHTSGRTYRMNLSLADVEQRLDPRVFVRVHRSHLVNLDHVAAMTPYDGSRFQITLRSGATIIASRQRSRLLRQPGR
jgi:two-component system LytT family response regulator